MQKLTQIKKTRIEKSSMRLISNYLGMPIHKTSSIVNQLLSIGMTGTVTSIGSHFP